MPCNTGALTRFQIRCSRGQTVLPGQRINFSNRLQPLLPSNYAHTDISPQSVVLRVQDSFPDDAAAIFRQRIRAVKCVEAKRLCFAFVD